MEYEADIEKRRAQYRATAEALARIRTQEAAAMTDEEALRIMWSLKVVETPWREQPDWTGLAEMQAKFSKWRKK